MQPRINQTIKKAKKKIGVTSPPLKMKLKLKIKLNKAKHKLSCAEFST
jgi:hypothetical protein